MTYEKLIEKINQENSGIAKGYDVNFLQEEFVYRYGSESENNFDRRMSKDLEMFKAIEKALFEAAEPKEGDFVEYEGGMARICSTRYGDTFQLSNSIGIYVSEGGYTQASGCTWDPSVKVEDEAERLKFSNLTLTPNAKKGRCWTFSGGEAGGGRGVYFEIDFKVWLLN